jgi:16S rRNA (cytidine1402-2'-O)-methyltransferase
MEKIEPKSIYIVSTPIGNLEDISFRAIHILKHVNLILCEDTRVSKTLFRYYDIQTPYQSYHEHTSQNETLQIIEKIISGQSVAVISDAGTPLISDPGYELIQLASEYDIRLIPIGGASAVLNALVASKLPPYPFYFGGFFPKKESKQQELLIQIKSLEATIVFYEAPTRIKKSLNKMYQILGARKLTLARELTKKFETIYYGDLEDIEAMNIQEKGEYVILIHGIKYDEKPLDQEVFHQYKTLLKEGFKKNEAMKKIATDYKQSKNTVYAFLKTKGDQHAK